MGARNGEHGYGWVTKTLHWSTVALVLAQFVVGPDGTVKNAIENVQAKCGPADHEQERLHG